MEVETIYIFYYIYIHNENCSKGDKKQSPAFLQCDHFLIASFKGELRPEISLLHMKVLTLIKAKYVL